MSFQYSINKTIGLPGLIKEVFNKLSIQRIFLREQVDPVLDEFMARNDGSLGQQDLDKIHHYYGLAVPAILGEAFCALRGSIMTDTERWASSSQGCMTGLFDDFFDKDYLTDEAVEKMVMLDQSTNTRKTNQQLFDYFYLKALACAPDKKAVQQSLMEVYHAQVLSKKQQNNVLPYQELADITFLKGGTSLYFYRTVFSRAASEQEKELMYGLGGCMQLCNDIFDVYKDRESGVETLLTTAVHIKPIRELLLVNLKKYYKAAFGLGYSAGCVRKFLDIISIGIFSRALVCLDQLEANESTTGNCFRVKAYSRKQLICDMDTTGNKLRSAWKHILQIP